MSRGLENRNPGNIRRAPVHYKGEVRPSRDPDFKEFESLAWATAPSSCCSTPTAHATG